MKHINYPYWQWYELQYLKFLHKNLTTNWYVLMYGVALEAKQLWWEVFQALELDRMSQRDLLNMARRYAENGEDLGEKIRCRRSDEVSVQLGVAGGPTEIFVGVSLASWQGSLVHREGRHGYTS